MKVRFNIGEQAPTIIFSTGLLILCGSIAQWSETLAGVIFGGALMVVGALPAYLTLFRGMTRRKE